MRYNLATAMRLSVCMLWVCYAHVILIYCTRLCARDSMGINTNVSDTIFTCVPQFTTFSTTSLFLCKWWVSITTYETLYEVGPIPVQLYSLPSEIPRIAWKLYQMKNSKCTSFRSMIYVYPMICLPYINTELYVNILLSDPMWQCPWNVRFGGSRSKDKVFLWVPFRNHLFFVSQWEWLYIQCSSFLWLGIPLYNNSVMKSSDKRYVHRLTM